jgi:hypothetical protein
MTLALVSLLVLFAPALAESGRSLERLSWRADQASRRALERVPPAEFAAFVNAFLEPIDEAVAPAVLRRRERLDGDPGGAVEDARPPDAHATPGHRPDRPGCPEPADARRAGEAGARAAPVPGG